MARLALSLLGPLQVRLDDQPLSGLAYDKVRALLAYLAVEACPHGRDALAELLWPEQEAAAARRSLRVALSTLRQALGEPSAPIPFLIATRESVQVNRASDISLDLTSFTELLHACAKHAHPADTLCSACAARLSEALALYRGEFLQQLAVRDSAAFEEWVTLTRERLHRAALEALAQLASYHEGHGEDEQARQYAWRTLALEGWDEAAHRCVMRVLSRKGQRSAALAQYERCRKVLAEELGVEPSTETTTLYELIRDNKLRMKNEELRSKPMREEQFSILNSQFSIQQHNLPTPPTPPIGREAYDRLVHPAAPPATGSALQTNLGETLMLVGRTQEWAKLQVAWRAAADGRPQVVVLAGEAGIGKTRLAEELTTWVGRQGIATATARCYAAEGAPAYAPVTAWLRSDALRPALSHLDTVWLTEVARLAPELLVEHPDLPRPTPLTEPWQHQHLRDALARAVLGSRQPLLLFIDDLQWCDLETLEWLHYLLRFDPQAPLLLAATVRSEELTDEHSLTTWLVAVRRARQATEIELSPLDQAETAELVAQVTGAAPDPLLAMHVYSETEGNPLFVVETARAGIAPGPHPLPSTMQAVIARRLAQLAPPARELVHVAATIGRSFTVEVLAHATDSDEDALVRGLDELWQRRIVREHGDETYDFSHDKIREVAYGEMSAARRRLLHRRVAAALEAVYAHDLDTVSGPIAAHYERAGQAGRAVAYYRRAAEVARQVYANADAIDYCRRALTLLDVRTGRAEAADLLERLGNLLELTGQHDEAGDAYRRALESAEPDAIARARLLRKQGVVLMTQRRYSEAQQACEAAEAALGQEPGDENIAWWQEWIQIQTDKMMLHYWQGNVNEIGKLVEKTRPITERYGTPAQRAEFFKGLSWFHLRRDRYVISPETLDYAQRCLAAQQQTGGLSELASAHFVLGFAWLWYGDLDTAEQEMLTALELAERSGDVTTQSRCLTYLTIVERKRGRIDGVREYVRRSVAVATAGQMLEYLGAAKGNLAWLAWRAGDLDEARTCGQEALDLWRQFMSAYPFQWIALWPLIGVTLAQDQLVETIDHVRHLLEPIQQRMPDALEAILYEALHEWEQGRPEPACERLHRVVEPAKVLGYL